MHTHVQSLLKPGEIVEDLEFVKSSKYATECVHYEEFHAIYLRFIC